MSTSNVNARSASIYVAGRDGPKRSKSRRRRDPRDRFQRAWPGDPDGADRRAAVERRNYSDLACSQTNVHRSPLSIGFCGHATPREGSFQCERHAQHVHNFMMDGVITTRTPPAPGFSNQVGSLRRMPSANQVITVITAPSTDAWRSRVNTVMRSGGNSFHGTAYEFLRNTELNAIGYVFGSVRRPSRSDSAGVNQFGATIAAPSSESRVLLRRYEGFRQLSAFLNFDSIPNAVDRSGHCRSRW